MRIVSFAWVGAALFAVAASSCSGSSSSGPAGPSAMPGAPSVSDPQVLVGGVAMTGLVPAGMAGPSLFRVRVYTPAGLASVRSVTLRYQQAGPNHPFGGMMMGGFAGTVLCYDDGTHGDEVAGDGIYSFLDPDDQIGCGGLHSPAGEYHYEFWCDDVYGQRSDTVSLTIEKQ